jgi:hypothetical protein
MLGDFYENREKENSGGQGPGISSRINVLQLEVMEEGFERERRQ